MTRILKFGGSSVATPERVRAVAHIVRDAAASGDVVVVVSAFGGVTDALLGAARAAEAGDPAWERRLKELRRRHLTAVAELATAPEQPELTARVEAVHGDLEDLIRGIFMVREASPRALDRVLSVGERVSANCVAAALRGDGLDSRAVDARDLILTDDGFGAAIVQEEETHRRIREALPGEGVPVVTGFIARGRSGQTTTLGRGGSDYTASILGAALGADAVELWTDVDGVLSADPRIVHDAVLADRLGYDELMELSHFGAKVVHPPSVRPTRARSIPLLIRNTFRPDGPGTRVDAEPAPLAEDARVVRGIASIPRVALLRLEGAGMVGVRGTAMRLFGALARGGVNVILITQASSEHSICFAVSPEAADDAVRAVEEEFEAERRAGLIDPLVVEPELSVVAAVGAGMRERSGVAGRLFAVLGHHGINVRAIAQGSSELNVSIVVAAADEARTIRAIHDAFFLSGERTVDVYLAGVGRVGGALLDQIAAQAPALSRERRLRLRLAGVASSRGARLDPEGIAPETAREAARSADASAPLDAMVEAAVRDRGRDRVFVDATAGDEVPAHYARLLEAGVAVVTANKRKLASSQAEWDALATVGRRLYHETTVGAALPVIGTLRDLVATGDHVRRIEGVLSGTLAFLLDALNRGEAFSAAVRRAHELGYTEPDPREDLGGRDVARKLLILSRLAGRRLEPEAMPVEPLIPPDGFDSSLDDFWERLPSLDDEWAGRVREAAGREERLVYLARLDGDEAAVGLSSLPASHAAVGSGTDNLVAFTTERYAETPLVVRGPGAGPELTASGVFADVLRAIEEGDAS